MWIPITNVWQVIAVDWLGTCLYNVGYSVKSPKKAYWEFSPREEPAQSKIESYPSEVKNWIAVNWLKLNDSITEIIIFGAKWHLSKTDIDSVTIGESSIPSSDCVKSIGVTLDCNLKMEKQIALPCILAWFYLHQISNIKKYLDEE